MTYFGYGYGSGGGSGINLRLIIGVAVILFGVISYYTHETVNPTTGERQHVAMSAQDEIALGLQSAPQMAAQMGGEVPQTDPRAREVSHIGQRIVQRSEAGKSPYHYQYHLLSDTQTVNAFALPGGQVFITLGLYQKLGDEAELAAVLGHETGHVVERHVAQQIEKSRLGQSIVLGTGIAASGNRNGFATWAMADLANEMVQLKFSREDESQADERGLEFMTEAGYDPRAMIDVMNILKQVGAGGHTPEFLETHPDPGNRIQAIESWMQDHPFIAPQLTRGDPLPQ
ncbi:MAG TPA: M48 family metalloprotease [Tepidisphaeraceae bacterium]|jgi:predicted Zn-dependent protease|nr:M48 family metalloprotease [Tepidisphaeraceae bacterium]